MKGNKGSVLRPVLMVAFVMVMVFLMQQNLEEKKDLKQQETEIDPASVIYSDIGVEGEVAPEKPNNEEIDEKEATPEEIEDVEPTQNYGYIETPTNVEAGN